MKKLIAVILLCTTLVSAQTICDSVSYNVSSGQAFTLTGVNNSSDSVNFQWGVCYNLMCYSKTGDTVVFADVTTLDTVSVCFDISPQWSCNDCQYLIFVNGSWQPITTTTHVNEATLTLRNGKAYDLLGRELKHIPAGTIYIKNGRLYR